MVLASSPQHFLRPCCRPAPLWPTVLDWAHLLALASYAASFASTTNLRIDPGRALLIDGGCYIVQFPVLGSVLGAWHR